MGVLVAQKFEIVRGEIDDEQPAARSQHSRRLFYRARAVVEEVQDLVDDDGIETVFRQREIVDIALANAAMPQSGAIKPRASKGEHVEGEIEPETALDLRREQFEHPPRPSAEIEKCAKGSVRERPDDRRLDRLIGDMQLADAVPLGRVLAKIILRRLRPLRPHRGETLAIA